MTNNFIDSYTINKTEKIDLSSEDKKFLKAHPEIRLAVDKDFPPFESVDQTSSKYKRLQRFSAGFNFSMIGFLADYSSQLHDCTQNFQVDDIEHLMSEYPAIIDKIKQISI